MLAISQDYAVTNIRIISFGCEGEESCVTSQQASDCFLFDSKITVGISFDHYKLGDYETH